MRAGDIGTARSPGRYTSATAASRPFQSAVTPPFPSIRNAKRVRRPARGWPGHDATACTGAPEDRVARFTELLFGMRWDDPEVRPLLELEGLKVWLPGRTSAYDALARAADDKRFYDSEGNILASDYRY